jgi:invasion protein IalB
MIRSATPSRAEREAFPRVLLPLLLSLTLSSAALAQQQSPAKPTAPADAKATSSKTAKSQGKPDERTTDAKSTKGKTSQDKTSQDKTSKDKTSKDKTSKEKTAKGKEDKAGKKVASLGDGKPVLLENYHDWGAYMAQGKEKTCYALASPKERAPSTMKRDQAYVFISSRPSENVRNEVSIIMGFAMKDNSGAKVEIGNASYDLIAKGTNAWVKNPAQETQFIDAMKRGSKLTIKAASSKGNQTTDSYSLAGLSQALDRVQKECQ